MITPKDTIGYIQRRRDSEGNETFKFIEAKVKRVNIGKTKTSVYTKEFYPLDAEEIESNTKIIDEGKGILLVGEPFLLKDGDSDYYRAVVGHWNTCGVKHWWEE